MTEDSNFLVTRMRTSNAKTVCLVNLGTFRAVWLRNPLSWNTRVRHWISTSRRHFLRLQGVWRSEHSFRTSETLKMKQLPPLRKSGTAYPVMTRHISEERAPLHFTKRRKRNSSKRPELLTQWRTDVFKKKVFLNFFFSFYTVFPPVLHLGGTNRNPRLIHYIFRLAVWYYWSSVS